MPTNVDLNLFDVLPEDVAEGVHDLGSDTLKAMLSNTAPTASDAQKSDITEISAGNGYTAGGHSFALTSSSQTSGLYKLILADLTIAASGGSIGPFRYVVFYNDTSTNDKLIGWWDYGSSTSITDGNQLTIDTHATNGVLQIENQ